MYVCSNKAKREILFSCFFFHKLDCYVIAETKRNMHLKFNNGCIFHLPLHKKKKTMMLKDVEDNNAGVCERSW